ncbi:hypothetical protein ADEAN_000808900 [Angomonas deanei]|uniref:MSP domain-containing protein n=1 Tax=Angomonas deanei TaxID=59799 RepID=A0A7G2CNB1_9TRYP|nr:hypothetical protein ADEAN_000808900 [Angomonas deanei]
MNTHKGSTAASVSKGSRTTSKPQSLSISPEIGEFINFDTDTTYVLSFTIRNCSPTSQIIRFVAPQKAKTFRLVNQSSVRLAPGIAQKVEVEFSTHTTEDYEDSFAVLNDRGERFNVPLSAKSVPELVFPTSLDFGRAEHHRVGLQKVLSIVNRGRKAAQVSLVSDSECVSATPAVLEAKALSSTDVTVELSRLTPGTHTWKLSLRVDGEEGYTKDIAIVVDVIDGRSSLFDPSTQKEVVSVCFQPCYEGAKKKYKLIVINGSENSTSFAFQLTNESLSRELPPFRFEPEQGRLQPREHKEILVLV